MNIHPIEGNCRYKRYSWHQWVRHLPVVGQEFLPLFIIRTLFNGLQIHGYVFGAFIHYSYWVYVIFNHASDKLQSNRRVFDNVDGTCVYNIRLTLDRSVLACELISVVCFHRLHMKDKMRNFTKRKSCLLIVYLIIDNVLSQQKRYVSE